MTLPLTFLSRSRFLLSSRELATQLQQQPAANIYEINYNRFLTLSHSLIYIFLFRRDTLADICMLLLIFKIYIHIQFRQSAELSARPRKRNNIEISYESAQFHLYICFVSSHLTVESEISIRSELDNLKFVFRRFVCGWGNRREDTDEE